MVMPPGLPQRLRTQLEGCQERSGEAYDWCALALVERRSEDWGPYLGALCPLMEGQEARARCLELAMRGPVPPDAALCDTLEVTEARAVCGADAVGVALGEGDAVTLTEVLGGCAATEPHQARCLVFGVTALEHRWARAGVGVMVAELGALAHAEPELLELETFGEAVGGVAARRYRTEAALVCGTLGEGGTATEACLAVGGS